jgi:hypothetical protein
VSVQVGGCDGGVEGLWTPTAVSSSKKTLFLPVCVCVSMCESMKCLAGYGGPGHNCKAKG